MIRNKVQVGATLVETMIELGNGDVKVAALRFQDDKQVGVEFVNDVPNPIGKKHNTSGTTTDESNPQVILSFTNVESIDVVERALNKAKVMLRNMK